MNADGSNQKRLTENSQFDSAPAWSPDGSKIKFVGGSPGQIHVMNPDGTEPKRITNFEFGVGPSRWSPDGSRIAIVAFLGDFYVMNADGSDLKRLTNLSFEIYSLGGPSWSPDGSRIAFSAYEEERGLNQIYLLMSDGTGMKQLTSPYSCHEPSWSPVTF